MNKGSMSIVTESLALPETCEKVNVLTFFNDRNDFTETNIEINFERVMLLAKAYNRKSVAFVIEPKSFSLKWHDRIVHVGKRMIESFIANDSLNVFLVIGF